MYTDDEASRRAAEIGGRSLFHPQCTVKMTEAMLECCDIKPAYAGAREGGFAGRDSSLYQQRPQEWCTASGALRVLPVIRDCAVRGKGRMR
jgi:hypothetical protein